MPSQQQQVQTSPSGGILNKLFGSDTLSDPKLEQAWQQMQMEYPNRTAATPRISEMGPISRLINRGAYATTNPLGMISLNTPLIKSDNADVDSVLAHELTHVNQVKNNGILQTLYNNFVNSDKYENEAYNEEARRRSSLMNFKRDINLPNAR
jgi:hypothetical protein